MKTEFPPGTARGDEARLAPRKTLTSAEVLAAAESLVPLLKEHAVQVDRERRIPREVFQAILDAGLLHILKPRRYAGFELTEHDHTKVAMTLARGCASTAWVFSILSSDNMAILAYPEEVQEEIWGTNTYATLAGNTNLNPKATVRKVKGGYRVSGSWGFCSGSDFSEWLIFNAPHGDEGEGHMFLVPSEEAETIDDWFPTGLRGTGSRTKVVKDVFVPERRAQRTADTVFKLQERRSLHPTFDAMYAPWPSYGRSTFASVGVGAAAGAFEHFIEHSGSASRVANALGGALKLVDQDYVATEYAEAAGEVELAELLLDRLSRRASEEAAQRIAPDEPQLAAQNRDNALAARIALRAVHRLQILVGARAHFPEHPLSRASRDVELVASHVTLNWRQAAVRYLASRVPRS